MKNTPLDTRLRDGTIEFAECSYSAVSEVLRHYHYLHRMPAGVMACYGLFDKTNLYEAVGAAVFSNGRIQYDGIHLEFARLWVSNDLGTNTESFFVAKCLRALRKKFPNYKGVVTWADPKRGHNGTLYKACNFTEDGMSRAVRKYKRAGGGVAYERTATDSNQERVIVGIDEPKHRFIYWFDRKK